MLYRILFTVVFIIVRNSILDRDTVNNDKKYKHCLPDMLVLFTILSSHQTSRCCRTVHRKCSFVPARLATHPTGTRNNNNKKKRGRVKDKKERRVRQQINSSTAEDRRSNLRGKIISKNILPGYI